MNYVVTHLSGIFRASLLTFVVGVVLLVGNFSSFAFGTGMALAIVGGDLALATGAALRAESIAKLTLAHVVTGLVASAVFAAVALPVTGSPGFAMIGMVVVAIVVPPVAYLVEKKVSA